MIERVKLTASAKQQLTTLKKRTGIEHYNVICRHALILSLSNPSSVPDETYQFANGLEIDWNVFTGGQGSTYLNLLLTRATEENIECNDSNIRHLLVAHLHRGLSYLVARKDLEISVVSAY
jgi:DNA sulfur modification protein DndE